MADADAPPKVRFEPLHLRFMPGGAEPAPDWQGAEPPYDHIYVIRIMDANPKHFRAYLLDLPVTVGAQAELRWSDVANAEQNGRVVSGGIPTDLDLVLNTGSGALVVFHLLDMDAVFEDPANIGGDETIVLADRSDMIFQPRWVDPSNPRAVSVILKGNPNYPTWNTGRYGLRLKITIPSSDTISYVEIDPKVENQGEGGQ